LVSQSDPDKKFDVVLKYITSRGHWYHFSWKGDINKSGGIATNIGVHFFDMLLWVFGNVLKSTVEYHEASRAAGYLSLEKANVKWQLSIDENDLPEEEKIAGMRTFRSIKVDEQAFEFSDGFTDLHTRSYAKILSGEGFGLEETRKAIELIHTIRGFSKGSQHSVA
jgi:UDP-N-acetyl-2-amino-2-deoxyglucuronate dehydrogenase